MLFMLLLLMLLLLLLVLVLVILVLVLLEDCYLVSLGVILLLESVVVGLLGVTAFTSILVYLFSKGVGLQCGYAWVFVLKVMMGLKLECGGELCVDAGIDVSFVLFMLDYMG